VTAPAPNVRLELSSAPENVGLVRQALRGLGEAVQLDEIELNDITTAVTEACNNVVAHAYSGGVGDLEVEIAGSAGGVDVLVRDHGVGIGDAALQEQSEAVEGGIGLPVMRALAQQVVFAEPAGGGTDVSMRFQTTATGSLAPPAEGQPDDVLPSRRRQGDDAAWMAIAPAPLARAVLRRVLSALLARARFSADRVVESQRLADGLVAHLCDESSASMYLIALIAIVPRELELRVGPLRGDSSANGLAPLLERLADGHQVERSGGSEVVAVRLVEADRGTAAGP